jgi:F-type H+-transporting ATPase subunit b
LGTSRAVGLNRGGYRFGSSPEANAEGAREERELLFKIVNFVILAGGLAFLLRKPLGAFFSERSNSIRRSLEDGRKALEAAQAQLRAAEEKLRHLEEEIAAFKASATREMEAERERLRLAAAAEAEKILAAARTQIETAVRQAKLELKTYAAQQAVDRAAELVQQRLDDDGRRRLVDRFVARLAVKNSKN